jgi:hypothetical protein
MNDYFADSDPIKHGAIAAVSAISYLDILLRLVNQATDAKLGHHAGAGPNGVGEITR